jgi:hypothetical protein
VDAKILKADPPDVFDAAALESVRNWQFTPLCGSAFEKPFHVSQTVAFKIPKTRPSAAGNFYPPQYVNRRLAPQESADGLSLTTQPDCKP